MPGKKGSRHVRGYGSAWDRIRKVALDRDRYLCQCCFVAGRTTVATDVDHILPKAKGGSDDLDNLQSLCQPCHAEKTARDEGRRYRPRPRVGADGWPVA